MRIRSFVQFLRPIRQLTIPVCIVLSLNAQGQSGDIPTNFAASIEVVARSGDQAEFGFLDLKFTFFDSVELLSDTVIFNGFTDAPVPGFAYPAEGSGLYYQVSDSTHPAIALANTGDPLPGVTTGGQPLQFGHIPNGDWVMNERGFLAYNALAAGTGGPSSGGRATIFSQEAFGGAPQLITNFEGQDPRVDNGSMTIDNLTTGTKLGGFFNPAVFNTNLGVTDSDQVVLAGDFGGGVPGGGSGQVSAIKRGIYVYPVNNKWAAIIRVGDPSPIIGEEVTGVSMATSIHSSDALITTSLKNGTIGFWRFDSFEGKLTLIAFDNLITPGFVDRIWNPQAPLLGFDDQVFFYGTVTKEGETTYEVIWTEKDFDGVTLLDPIVVAAEDGSVISPASGIANKFLSISQPLPGPDDTIYFFATAQDQDDAFLSGLWKLNFENKTVDLLVETNSEAPGQSFELGVPIFQSFELWDVNSHGQLLFSATLFRNGITAGSLWLLDSEGELFFIAKEGDIIGREGNQVQLDKFFFNRYAGSIEARSAVLSDTVTVAFLGQIPDGEDLGTNEDSAVFRAEFKAPPGDNYFWSGDADSNQWHEKSGAVTNWQDDQQTNWTEPPGTKGNEVVTIDPAANVMLNTAPADIGSLDAKGALTINQTLTIREFAEIENLNLAANLVADGAVGLNGSQNIWRSGELSGESRVEVDSSGILTIAPSAQDAAVLKSVLRVSGQVIQENGDLTLADNTLNQAGHIEIETGGNYELLSGAINDTSSGDSLIINLGTFHKKGVGMGVVSVPLSSSFGLIDVQGGELKLTGDTRIVHEGTFALVAEDSVLEFGDADSPFQTITLSGKPIARGAGTLRLAHEVSLDINTGAAVFGLTGSDEAGLEITKADIFGNGGFLVGDDQFPTAKATFLDAYFQSLQSGLTNNGILDLGKEAITGTTALTLDKTQFINNAVVTQYGDIEVTSTGDGFIAFDNHGTYTLEGENRIFTNHPVDSFHFNNATDGRLEKSSPGKSTFGADFDNQGSISVTQGTLALASFNKFKLGSVITLGAEDSRGTMELGVLGFDLTTDIEASMTFAGLKADAQGTSDKLVINSGLNLADNAVLKTTLLETKWQGGEIKGPTSSKFEVAKGSIFNIPSNPPEVRDLSLPLEIKGTFIQNASITRGELPSERVITVTNFGIHRIGNNADVEFLDLKMEPKSQLFIEPASNTEIINLEMAGTILGLGTAVIDIGSEATLKLGLNAIDNKVRISSGVGNLIDGEGNLRVERTTIEMTNSSHLFLGASEITLETVEVNASPTGTLIFEKTMGSDIMPSGSIKGSKFNQVNVSNDIPLTMEGTIQFTGGTLKNGTNPSPVVALTLDTAKLEGIGAIPIRNFGTIIMKGTSSIDSSFNFEDALGPRVRALDRSIGSIDATVTNFVLSESPLISSNTLLAGDWTVESGGRLQLTGGLDIFTIGGGADAKLHGTGTLNNLPNITGDFTNDGSLFLADNAVFNVSGTFFNNGNVTLEGGGSFNGRYRGISPSFIRGRNGSISGDTENGGTLKPGKDSAVDDSEPVFVPTSDPGSGTTPNLSSFFEKQSDASGGLVKGGLETLLADEDAIGIITIDGNYTQTETGVLDLDLGGTTPEESDQFIVNGTATLDGTLRLRLNDDTFPANGTAFAPVTATAIVGQFDDIIYDLASGRQVFDVVISETGVTASAITLDVGTFGEWQARVFTASALADEEISGLAADPDEDGLANLLEYALDGNPRVVTQPSVEVDFGFNAGLIPETVTVVFPWANGLTDVVYDLEYSTNLTDWVTLSPTLENTEDVGIVTLITLTTELDMPNESVGFVRLIVSQL